MTREETIEKINKIIVRANKFGEAEKLSEIFIFGSFSRGSKAPNDCDVLLVFESDKDLIYTKEEKLLKIRFGGRISKVDMLICSSHDFNDNYHFLFKKESLIKIWTRGSKNEWKNIIAGLGNKEMEREYIKPIQPKLFKMHPGTLKKIEFAFEKNIIQIREIKASDYLDIKEKWICESYSFDSDGNEVIEDFDEYEEMMNYLLRLEKNKIKKAYIRTLKLMYIYAYKNNHFFHEYYNENIKHSDGYETHFYTDTEKILYVIYNPNLENIFFHLENQKSLRTIVIIPWVRTGSKENYFYEIKRGRNWRKTYLEKLSKIY